MKKPSIPERYAFKLDCENTCFMFIFAFLMLEGAFDGSAHIHVALSSKKDVTALTGFHNSCQRNDGGLLVNVELACRKIAFNMSKNILTSTGPVVCSKSGLHTVVGGSQLIHIRLNSRLYSRPNMHKPKMLI